MKKNEVKAFSYEANEVRTIDRNGEPWFVGKDIAEILGYSNSKDAIISHVDDEDKAIIQRSQFPTLEIPNRGLTIINESGLYSLILTSKLPTAKNFKRWVTSEVLPSIRKTGIYNGRQQVNETKALMAVTHEENTKIKKAQILMRLCRDVKSEIQKAMIQESIVEMLTGNKPLMNSNRSVNEIMKLDNSAISIYNNVGDPFVTVRVSDGKKTLWMNNYDYSNLKMRNQCITVYDKITIN